MGLLQKAVATWEVAQIPTCDVDVDVAFVGSVLVPLIPPNLKLAALWRIRRQTATTAVAFRLFGHKYNLGLQTWSVPEPRKVRPFQRPIRLFKA